MLKIRRICVPLSLDCNLHCKYCFRDLEKLDSIPDFTSDMIQYLQNLNPSWCEAVIASGGEPLLHWDKVLELFSYTPKNVHKVIMTNGTLLTQDKVDYINENNIEISLSHDGKMTEFLRGIDVFNDKILLNLIKQIEILRIYAVCTVYNNDVWENFFNSISRLDRTDIYYDTIKIEDNNIPHQYFLIDNFDYDLFIKTFFEFFYSSYYKKSLYRFGKSLTDDPIVYPIGGFNILPNGIVCGITKICSEYGTIDNIYEELNSKIEELEQRNKCKTCNIKDNCNRNPQFMSNSHCLLREKIIKFANNNDQIEYLREHIEDMLPEIEAKYGYIRKK